MKSNQRQKITGEVFTPRTLIREMLDKLPNEVWFDPNKTWLEPAAGDGNFLVEVKSRLMQVGHDEKHILDNMLFSIELIDDNHFVLQYRLGYITEDGIPNEKIWTNYEIEKYFKESEIDIIAQDLNDYNPYHIKLGLDKNKVLFHRNHLCCSALKCEMNFEYDKEEHPILPLLPIRDLSFEPWLITDTPDIGEQSIVNKMFSNKYPDIPKEIKSENKLVIQPKIKKVPKSLKSSKENIDDFISEVMLLLSEQKPILNKKCITTEDGTKWICCSRLKASKKDNENSILVFKYLEEPWIIRLGDWLDTGPRNTKSWDKGSYLGGPPTEKLLQYMSPLKDVIS